MFGKKTIAAIGMATAAGAFALPTAVPAAGLELQVAQSNPCSACANPCAAKNNPCCPNPCAAANPCAANHCNPCKAN